ncbi:MAG: radical SAM protein [Acidobacteriia bacterium]|nr:radical SAM protein [Terriglobia bacterium]
MSSLPLLDPCESPSSLVGIARLAAEGKSISQGHEVEFFTLAARSLLNRCTAPRMPFTWTINPYRGCEFACKYCYARYTHEFMEMRDGVEFERKIYVKQRAAELLTRDLRKVKPGEEIAIGTATDPYQPAERHFGVTRAILEVFAEQCGRDIGIVTKSDLVLRDAELLCQVARRNKLFVNLTITTLNSDLARILEPRAPRPDLRMKALQKLNQAGVPAGVICAPVIPGITDSARDLDALVKATKEAGGRYIFANPLFLKPCSAAIFLPWLEKEFPHLVRNYRERYGERAYLGPAYRKRISQLMARLRQKHGIGTQSDRDRLDREAGEQCAVPRAKAVRSVSLSEPPLFEEQMRLF